MTMVIDQATQLRSLMREQKRVTKVSSTEEEELVATKRASVIAITSGKGGVGKTNISVNLAIRLGRGG